MANDVAHAMRTYELELATPLLPAGARVLELGAGDGWQASQLSERGFAVTALDVGGSTNRRPQYFPVMEYDGTTLPFPDNSFDAVYSSNVMEHVVEFDKVQSELARVLTPGGIAVHCVPSATWRFWTTLGQPVRVVRRTLNHVSRRQPRENSPTSGHHPGQRSNRSLHRLLRMAGLPRRHGEHGNLLTEHYLFSKWHWRHRFRKTGWEIESERPTGIFYSGDEILGLRLPIHSRTRIAHWLGSSTVIFVLRPLQKTGIETADPPERRP
jgi:SAM-dependent methyltransferase